MSLVLDEWIQKLADARSKAEMTDVLEAMPIWRLVAYHDTIIKRLHSKGFSEAATYVAVWRHIALSPRPTDIELIKSRGQALAAMHAAVAAETEAATAAEQALERELSLPE
jgi:hypothetical protein